MLEPKEHSSFYETFVPVLPAFSAYEKALIDWSSKIFVVREDKTIYASVEYAGGERAVVAINGLRKNRNDRAASPLITLRLVDIKPFNDRYHPPESPWTVAYNAPDKEQATRAARIPKPMGYQCSYDVAMYANYEGDLRLMVNQMLSRFQRHGGNLSYLVSRGKNGKQYFPVWLRSMANATNSPGDGEREVKATLSLEVEAYLPLPYQYVPTFRKYVQQLGIGEKS